MHASIEPRRSGRRPAGHAMREPHRSGQGAWEPNRSPSSHPTPPSGPGCWPHFNKSGALKADTVSVLSAVPAGGAPHIG